MAETISQNPSDANEIVVHECELTDLAQKRVKPGPKGGTWTTTTYEGIIVGRDKVVIPPEQVFELAKLGLKSSEIARFFGVKIESINRHFASEIEKGYEMMKISLRRAMLNNAISNGNAAVQIFLAKNILGMSDQPTTTDDAKVLPWTDDGTEHTPTEDNQ